MDIGGVEKRKRKHSHAYLDKNKKDFLLSKSPSNATPGTKAKWQKDERVSISLFLLCASSQPSLGDEFVRIREMLLHAAHDSSLTEYISLDNSKKIN